MKQPKTPEEKTNDGVIHELYASAEAAAKDTPKFVSLFAEEGYFYDVAAGKKYSRMRQPMVSICHSSVIS